MGRRARVQPFYGGQQASGKGFRRVLRPLVYAIDVNKYIIIR